MFYGREKELGIIKKALERKHSVVLVYGKRKVGKTTLIKEAYRRLNKDYIYFQCTKTGADDNLDRLTKLLADLGFLTAGLKFTRFSDLFALLKKMNHRTDIVIDEYSYLLQFGDAQGINSDFQAIIDNEIEDFSLILSGSQVGIMEQLSQEGNALFERFTDKIFLRPFDYFDAADFYLPLDSYGKAGFYSVFGGTPYILQYLDSSLSLKENIIRTILDQNSNVFSYCSNLALSDFPTSSLSANEKILSFLANGKKHYREIEEGLHLKANGTLGKQLSSLLQLRLIEKNFPIDRKDDNKKATYEIADNLLRFYYTFVFPHLSSLEMIGPEAFYEAYVSKTLNEFIARRFEETARQFFSRLAKEGKLPGIEAIGTYYYDDKKSKKNGEFDVALKYTGNRYEICEVKYLKDKMNLESIKKEIAQIKAIPDLNVEAISFLSVSGFAAEPEGIRLYTGKDLYQRGE